MFINWTYDRNYNSVICKNGQEYIVGGFTDVVITVGGKSYNPLEEQLKDKVDLTVIGDAKEVRQGINAVYEGYMSAYHL